MKDTIIKGSGNSRTIKTIPNGATIYPDFLTFIQAFATSGLPIDLLGLNAAGINQAGTDLNKANLLTDATEQAIWGSAADRTPDAALKQLRSLITTAQNTGNAKGYVKVGSYIGTGQYGASNPNTIDVGFPIESLILVAPPTDTKYVSVAIFIKGMTAYNLLISNNYADEMSVSWGNTYIKWYYEKNSASGQYNISGKKYTYIALG